MEIPYTAAAVGAILIILQQILMMNTGAYRGKVQIGVGFGDDRDLERKIRRHGNLAENAAIFVIVLALAEGVLGGGAIVTGFGVAFVIARICHAIAFTSLAGSHDKSEGSRIFLWLRASGAVASGVSGIGLGLYLLYGLLA